MHFHSILFICCCFGFLVFYQKLVVLLILYLFVLLLFLCLFLVPQRFFMLWPITKQSGNLFFNIFLLSTSLLPTLLSLPFSCLLSFFPITRKPVVMTQSNLPFQVLSWFLSGLRLELKSSAFESSAQSTQTVFVLFFVTLFCFGHCKLNCSVLFTFYSTEITLKKSICIVLTIINHKLSFHINSSFLASQTSNRLLFQHHTVA